MRDIDILSNLETIGNMMCSFKYSFVMILGFKNDNNDVRMLNIPLKLIILLAASFGGGRAQPVRSSHCIQSKRNQFNVVFEISEFRNEKVPASQREID